MLQQESETEGVKGRNLLREEAFAPTWRHERGYITIGVGERERNDMILGYVRTERLYQLRRRAESRKDIDLKNPIIRNPMKLTRNPE